MKIMSRKNFFKRLVTVAGIAAAALSGLAGCAGDGSQTAEVQHVAVVMSNTKNEGSIDTGTMLSDLSDLTMAAGSTVSYFNADGNPEYVDTLTIPEYKRGITHAKKKQLSKDYAEQIVAALTGLAPDDEELDTYKAITLAARQLQEYGGEKTLYIASSGLSTMGLVDFTNLYLEQDHSDEVVEALKDELPNLMGVKVVWFGLGEVCGEQTDLYESNRAILENTWKKLLIASGVNEEDITFSTALAVNTDDKSSDFPYVSVVPVSQPVSIMADKDFEFESVSENDKSEENEDITTDKGEGTFFDLSDKVSFKPDSTELLTNREEVAASLSKMIDYLREESSRQILLVGTTSSWGEEAGLREFSLKRCETIKEVLVEKGVLASQIQCIGAGYDNNLTKNDRDENGLLVEELAVKNRAVYLYTNAQSLAAQKILEQFSE